MSDNPSLIGLFVWGYDDADCYLWQTTGPMGRHGRLRFLQRELDVDHVLCLTLPSSRRSEPNVSYLQKRLLKLRGKAHYRREKTAMRFGFLQKDPSEITLLVYEPESAFGDEWYDAAHRMCGQVYGPDPRCTHQIRLPATWSFAESASALLAESPPQIEDKPMDLVCVTSGTRTYPGHTDRLEFIARLRDVGVPLDLFGRGLDPKLGSSGSVNSKATPLRAAKLTLAIENDASGEHYVSEKLWDPLLCWSLPLYYGSTAADSMIPTDSFIRLPDLGEAGVQAVRDALANPGLWAQRVEAIAEARKRILGEHNLMNWAERVMPV
ncbi:MAG: hypothetical protein ACI89L_000331 [Phycisphaerales bacterium]|jgi:hypothetical protein